MADALPTIDTVLQAPDTSYWLADALQKARLRDPLDALRDAELLVVLLNQRFEQVTHACRQQIAHGHLLFGLPPTLLDLT